MAAGIRTTLSNEEIDDARFRKIAAAVRASFQIVSGIENESDRTPTATVSLLRDLADRTRSTEQRKVLESAMGAVAKHTSPASDAESE